MQFLSKDVLADLNQQSLFLPPEKTPKLSKYQSLFSKNSKISKISNLSNEQSSISVPPADFTNFDTSFNTSVMQMESTLVSTNRDAASETIKRKINPF